MKVLLAQHLGMCFGVRDALDIARDVVRPEQVTIFGELVHNSGVTREMIARGFRMVAEAGRGEIPATAGVLITAHGVSDRERQRLAAAGKRLIDTTCPLVQKVHDTARELHDAGYHVVVIGKPDHVEVQGIVGDLERVTVVEHSDRAPQIDAPRLGVVCQTTVAPSRASAVLAALERANPRSEVRFEDTICQPTRWRQESVLALLRDVEALVVVGGRNSNNTRQLGRLAESHGIPWLHVESALELDADWLSRFGVVGLTAGTSTRDETIAEVHRALVAFAPLAARGASA